MEQFWGWEFCGAGPKQAALKLPYPLESSPLQQQGLSAGKCEIRLGAWLM